jgi:hypothetical protein
MSSISRSSASALLAVLSSGCSVADDKVLLVDEKTYASETCWADQDGIVTGYLTFGRNGQLAVPYLVSANCMVKGYSSYGEAVLHMLNTIRIADEYGTLKRAFPNIIISDNVLSDQPMPSSDSKMYYIRVHLSKSNGSYSNVLAPNRILELSDVSITFESFLGLSKDDREQLLKSR